MFDNQLNFDKNAYEANLKIITNFLIKLSFPQIEPETPFFETSESQISFIDSNMQSQMMNFLEDNPRIPSELSTDSKLLKELSRIVKFHFKNMKSKRVKVPNPKYYQDSPVRHVLLAYDYQSRILYILAFAVVIGALYYGYQYYRYGSKLKKD